MNAGFGNCSILLKTAGDAYPPLLRFKAFKQRSATQYLGYNAKGERVAGHGLAQHSKGRRFPKERGCQVSRLEKYKSEGWVNVVC